MTRSYEYGGVLPRVGTVVTLGSTHTETGVRVSFDHTTRTGLHLEKHPSPVENIRGDRRPSYPSSVREHSAGTTHVDNYYRQCKADEQVIEGSYNNESKTKLYERCNLGRRSRNLLGLIHHDLCSAQIGWLWHWHTSNTRCTRTNGINGYTS